MTPEELARMFHETYERLAPSDNYKTREASAGPWESVPEQNKQLMTAVAAEVLVELEKKQGPGLLNTLIQIEAENVTRIGRLEEQVQSIKEAIEAGQPAYLEINPDLWPRKKAGEG